MKNVVLFILIICVAVVACGVSVSVMAGSAERSFMYGVDAAAAHATNPQVQLERSLALQAKSSPTNTQSPLPYVVGAALMLAVYLIISQPERREAAAKYLKEMRLLTKAQKKVTRGVRMTPQTALPLPQFRPGLPAPEIEPEPEPEYTGETW